MDYTVELTILADKAMTEDALMDVAALGGAAGGSAGERRLETTLTVDADGIGDAITAASRKVVALVPGRIIAASAALVEEFDRRAKEARARGVLVGLAEVAKLLGLSRQRVGELVRTRSDVPLPVALLAAGPVWRKADWSTFKKGWRRKPGRPRKQADPVPVAAH